MKSIQQVSDDGLAARGAGLARAFWRWWLSELIALCPSRLVKSMHTEDTGPAIWLGEFTIDLQSGTSRAATTMSSFAVSDGGIRAAMAWLMANGMAGSGLVVLVPLSRCLVRTIKLPGVAREDIRGLLELDLAHATPFKPGSVHSTIVDDSPPGARSVTNVRQIVARRDLIDGPLAEILEQGLTVRAVHFVDEAGGRIVGDNLLPSNNMTRLAWPRARHWLWPVVATAFCALIWLSFARQEAALLRLREGLEAARANYQAFAAGKRRQEARSTATVELARLSHADLRISELLLEFTRLLPDSAWLTDLRIVDDKVEMSGFASAAAALIDTFTSVPRFSEVAFSAPVTRDDREGKDHFVLSLKVRRPN